MTTFDIADLALADAGRRKIRWAARHMPVLNTIREELAATRPLAGKRIAASLHITTETAVLLGVLRAGGAEIALCASNPLSTKDDVCAALVADDGIAVQAWHGEDLPAYERHLEAILATDPHLVVDDGADLIAALHQRADIGSAMAGIEETTTGVIRVRALDAEHRLRFPVIGLNDTPTKRMFDNRYGTGQNTLDGILRATNILLAGAAFVVAGYGWCGRGIAARARGMGARVIVSEVSAVHALEAVMEGFEVLPMAEAAPLGDIFVTATGMMGVVRAEHITAMKDGAILANSGHFDVEVEVAELKRVALRETVVRNNLVEYELEEGRSVFLLAQGRLVGQVAAEASPAAIMDLSFGGLALSARYLLEHAHELAPTMHDVPAAIDDQIAALKLRSLGVRLDVLDARQQTYARSWQHGTLDGSAA
jgi:adenosylhomocysteinase